MIENGEVLFFVYQSQSGFAVLQNIINYYFDWSKTFIFDLRLMK